ncbi:TPA: tRNA dihydrouridine synthase DusB [Candidatus Woesearchaeota archaeon]|nr:tRNA dihydrouridine synthase DusB [Candidatus Woesearchaeota archaeon]HIH13224.1 tRNA dihydrouridine synthase DusB [Candidatus Woesearchaeota archaeon]
MTLPLFSSKAFFAPMAGVSDPALRLLCKELGAGLVVTEFTNIHAVVYKGAQLKSIKEFIEYSEEERPVAIQLFGSDLQALEKAVKIVSPHFDIIDYNMGCPAPHITEQMACSALLQEPELTRKIFRTMVKATDKPVTVKIRAGVSAPDKWREIALIAEEEGLQMITFHPRTVKQHYSGTANWSLIKELKQLVKIPVVGNGDIRTPEDAKRMLDETGCDYVMIGRAACQDPFLFTQVNDYLEKGTYREISAAERIQFFFRYLDYARNYPTIPFASIRLQAMHFTKGEVGGKVIRAKIGKVQTIDELHELLGKSMIP